MDVKYVQTMTNKHTKEVTNKTNGVMTYYLYEDQNGNRKFDIVDSIDGDLDIEKIEKIILYFAVTIFDIPYAPGWMDVIFQRFPTTKRSPKMISKIDWQRRK